MKLHGILKICLLSLASRYPESVVEFTGVVIDHQSFCTEACSPCRLLELLESHASHLLQEPAYLVIDEAQSVIYLVEQSEETPAFCIYCGGYTPSHQ